MEFVRSTCAKDLDFLLNEQITILNDLVVDMKKLNKLRDEQNEDCNPKDFKNVESFDVVCQEKFSDTGASIMVFREAVRRIGRDPNKAYAFLDLPCRKKKETLRALARNSKEVKEDVARWVARLDAELRRLGLPFDWSNAERIKERVEQEAALDAFGAF
jgi:hypothetical protein